MGTTRQIVASTLPGAENTGAALGFVNAIPTLSDHPKVVNGCSDLFADVFDTIGGHARSAIGVGSLPGNITVEIEAVIEIAA